MSTQGQGDRRVPAWAGQRAATVEQRALQLRAELNRLLDALGRPQHSTADILRLTARYLAEVRSALSATWDDGEAAGERTRDRAAGETPVPSWRIPGRGEAP